MTKTSQGGAEDLAATRVDWSAYDFVDVGCSSGGSLRFCQKRFRAGRGLGVDSDIEKVRIAQAGGLDALHSELNAVAGSGVVRFVSMMQFLEHLPDLEAVERVISKAADLATDFLYIHHPSFEDEWYLLGEGLRLYYHHWSGHRAHVLCSEFFGIFERLGLLQYHVRPIKPIHDSEHGAILPSSAPINQHEYDAVKHGPKPKVKFRSPVYQHVEFFVALRPFEEKEWKSIVTG